MTIQQGAVAGALLPRILQDAPGDVIRWVGTAAVERHLVTWLSAELGVVGSLERAGRLRGICPVPGATDEDYLARVIDLPGGSRAVLHVRFKGGDAASPFVQWVAGEAPIQNSTELMTLATLARESFAVLRPPCMRIWIPSGSPWEPAGNSPECERGNRWLAAPLLAMVGRRPEWPVPGLRVVETSADDIFPSYDAEYRAYLGSHPQAMDWIRAENLETLRDCRRQGGLFAMLEGNAVRGLVALRRESSPWFPGWHVAESLVFDGFRGKGLAVPMHQAAYAQLVSEPDEFVWGTIDPRNAASIATAAALGRVDIGGDWWIGPRRRESLGAL